MFYFSISITSQVLLAHVIKTSQIFTLFESTYGDLFTVQVTLIRYYIQTAEKNQISLHLW